METEQVSKVINEIITQAGYYKELDHKIEYYTNQLTSLEDMIKANQVNKTDFEQRLELLKNIIKIEKANKAEGVSWEDIAEKYPKYEIDHSEAIEDKVLVFNQMIEASVSELQTRYKYWDTESKRRTVVVEDGWEGIDNRHKYIDYT